MQLVHSGGKYLFLVSLHNTVVYDQICPSYLLACLCQQLLQREAADDPGDWQTLLHSWMEGVKLHIPA